MVANPNRWPTCVPALALLHGPIIGPQANIALVVKSVYCSHDCLDWLHRKPLVTVI